MKLGQPYVDRQPYVTRVFLVTDRSTASLVCDDTGLVVYSTVLAAADGRLQKGQRYFKEVHDKDRAKKAAIKRALAWAARNSLIVSMRQQDKVAVDFPTAAL